MFHKIQGWRGVIGSIRLRTVALLTCVMMTLAACTFSVQLVGDYDALLDEAVMQLQSKTNAFYASYESATPPDTAAHDAFFAEAYGSIDTLIARAEVLEASVTRKPLTTNLESMKVQLQDAAKLDLTRAPMRTSSGKALQLSFNSLQTQLVWMKKTQTPPPAGQ